MKKRYFSNLAAIAALLCAFAAHAPAAQAQPAVDEAYTATVRRDEARFTLPVPARSEWRWSRAEMRENAREYLFGVGVKNEGMEYTFGLFLWKKPGSRPQSGSFSALVEAGQKSLFQHVQLGRNLIVRDAGVKVTAKGERLVITVRGRKNVERLFSGRPAEVTFYLELPEEQPVVRSFPVKYEE